MDLIKRALKLSIIGGLTYWVGLYLLHQAQLDFSSLSDWLFRGVLVIFVVLTIVATKAAKSGWLSFSEGFRVGMLATGILAIFIAVGTWLYCEYMYPSYTHDYEQEYRTMHYDKMMRKYIAETWKRDTVTQGARDTIQRGLDLNIKNYTGHMFTTQGQVQTNFVYSFFWGVMITLTVALLARKVEE
ncbi:DUF4199 domain-containing protein [Aureispira anguillae]|uniref:DUF4199 domain-containing protein n=1 Tax=Aureispira anguillae TaxID=2864201 RepID=A0A916DUC6_9BACT|nr:DUF4199 domain-containing protein [Aureispira anguillae]BDS12567.1 DUF4199 domain-containing protein [Aureispira anguillae]